MSTIFRSFMLRAAVYLGFVFLLTNSAKGQDTIAYYPFTGDLGSWTVTDLSATATDNNWTWSQTGPAGSVPISPITSTTGSDGFLLFDSDALCSGSQNARIQSPVLDLSQETVVELRWQQRYRRFESAIYVEVSRDAGQTFAPFELSPALMNDEFTGSQGENPDYVTLDISPVAAGETAVVIAFRFFSEPAIFGTDAGCGYAWMVDDVAIANSILPPAQNDLAIVSGSHAGAANSMTPSGQVEALNLGAEVVNYGVNAASGKLYVRIFDDSGVTPVMVYIDSVNVPTLNQEEVSDFLLMPGSFTPPADQKSYIGRYELVMNGSSDEATANNMARFDFSVSESAFAKTNGPNLYARPQSSESWGFGSIFSLRGVENELSKVLFWLRPVGDFANSTADSVFVEVYANFGDGDNDGAYTDGSESILLSRKGYSLEGLTDATRFFVSPLEDTSLAISPFVDQIAVFIRYEDALAGDSRWIEIGGGRDDAQTNYDAEQTAAVLKGISNRAYAIRSVGDGPLLASLSPGFIPDVRAYVNESQPVGTTTPSDLSVDMKVWPNPTSDKLNWSFIGEVDPSQSFSIQVIDALGRVAISRRSTEIAADRSFIEVASLPSGVYHLSVKIGDKMNAIRRFIIQ